MTVRELVDRYGPTLAVVAVLALLVVLLPSNSDGDADTSLGVGQSEQAGSVQGVAGGGASGTTGATDVVSGEAATGGGATATMAGDTGGAAATGTGSGSGSVAGSGPESELTAAAAPQQRIEPPAGADCRPEDGRQIGISYAMPPCVPRFSGDNGGATARGVTKDKVIVALFWPQENAAVSATLAAAGANDTREKIKEVYDSFRRYNNHHYETYGREVVFVDVHASGPDDNDAAMRSDAIKIAEEVKAFAAMVGVASQVLTEELAQRDVNVVRGTAYSRSFYQTVPMRIWAALPTLEQYYGHTAEYIGKRLWGRNAVHAGDDQDVSLQQKFNQQPRKFGLIWIEGVGSRVDPFSKPARDFFTRELANYGAKLSADASYTFDLPRQQQQSTSMISKMRSAGVSNIIFIGDPLYPIFLTQEATRQNYYPEWFITGTLLVDTTFFGRTYDQRQWRNAFGISPLWVFWENKATSAGYREYFHMNPDAEHGDESVGVNSYRSDPLLLFTGIHMAGPNLTPETFAQGMLNYPPSGGMPAGPLLDFDEKDPAILKDFTEVWWDAEGTGKDEADQEGIGILMKVDGGKRYKLGEWPATDPKVFNPDGAIYTTDEPPGGNPNFPHEEDGHTHEGACRSCG